MKNQDKQIIQSTNHTEPETNMMVPIAFQAQKIKDAIKKRPYRTSTLVDGSGEKVYGRMIIRWSVRNRPDAMVTITENYTSYSDGSTVIGCPFNDEEENRNGINMIGKAAMGKKFLIQ